MSIKNIKNSSASSRSLDTTTIEIGQSPSIIGWSRPNDWLTLPTITDADEKFVGLIGINQWESMVALRAEGDYTVDWGDGIVENYTSNTVAQHTYSFDNFDVSGTTLTSEGYKQAIVIVTPQAGQNLTTFSLQQQHNNQLAGTSNYRETSDWLDIAIAGSLLTNLIISDTAGVSNHSSTVNLKRLEQVKIYSNLVTNFSNMFNGCIKLKSIPILTTNNATIANSMFNGCGIEIAPTMNTSSVIHAVSMFFNCSSLTTVPNYNFSNVISFTTTFSGCSALKEVPEFNTVNAVSMGSMFSDCRALTKVPLFNTANVTTMSSMFFSCHNLEEVPLFNTAKVTIMSTMFQNCSKLVKAPYFDTSLTTTMQSMFLGCSSLKEVPIYNTANVTNFSSTFQNCYSLEKITIPDTPLCTGASFMFSGCYNLKYANIGYLPLVTNLGSMFSFCESLQKVDINGNTPSLTSTASMFNGAKRLISAPTLNTANVTTTASMFAGCLSLENVPLYDTANVTDMASMFATCRNIKTIPSFNTVKVTTMSSMFSTCTSLKTIPAFDTSNVTNMSSFVTSCTALESVPSSNTAKVTDFSNAFSGCTLLKVAPQLTMNSATNFSSMFSSCGSLTHIPAANVESGTNFSNIFASCFSLKAIPEWKLNPYRSFFTSTSATEGNKSVTKWGFYPMKYGTMTWFTPSNLGNFNSNSVAHFIREKTEAGMASGQLTITLFSGGVNYPGRNIYGLGANTTITRWANTKTGCTVVQISDTSLLSNGDYIIATRASYQRGWNLSNPKAWYTPVAPVLAQLDGANDTVKLITPNNFVLPANTMVAFSNTLFTIIPTDFPAAPNTVGGWSNGKSLITRSMAYGNNRVIAVGEQAGNNLSGLQSIVNNLDPTNHYLYSNNGIQWNAGVLPNVITWQSVVYGNGQFVAMGTENKRGVSSNVTIAKSSDGINWTSSIPVAQTISVLEMAYGDGTYMSAPYSNTRILRSIDEGTTWEVTNPFASPLGFTGAIRFGALTNGNNLFIICDGTNVRVSNNKGNTWFSYTSPWPSFNDGTSTITFDDTSKQFFVRSGSTNALVYISNTGINWTTETINIFNPSSATYPILRANSGNGTIIITTFANGGLFTSVKVNDSPLANGNLLFKVTQVTTESSDYASAFSSSGGAGQFLNHSSRAGVVLPSDGNLPERFVYAPGNIWEGQSLPPLPATGPGSNVGLVIIPEHKTLENTAAPFNWFNSTVFFTTPMVNNTFQLSNTPGGPVVNIPSSNVVNTGMFIESYITDINPNVSITLSGPFMTNSNTQIIFTGKLPLSTARLKGYATVIV